VTQKTIEGVRAQLAADGAMASVVTAILDRCDRRGSLPREMTLRCRCVEERDAAVRLLSAAAVGHRRDGDLTVKLDLARADARLRAEGTPGLLQILHAATGRPARNLNAETAALGKDAARTALALADRHSGAAAGFLRAAADSVEARRGELFDFARSAGLDRLSAELDVVARCIELAERNEHPLRLANFARRATGTSKGLCAGDRRYIRFADALLRHVPGLAERVGSEGPLEVADRRRLTLECVNIFRNETPIDVLCYGHLVLEKQGRRLDAAAAHRELGEPARLLLLHLRGARIAEIRAESVISIENETTFNDYVEWLRVSGRNEIVLFSEGQANWAVVRLLRLIAEAAPSVALAHWGDLDRFGVLILRSLRRRTSLPIEPQWMDARTFERCRDAGIPLPEGEQEEIDRLLSAATDDDVCNDLLRTIRNSGRWVEQETVAERVLDPRS
jgi:hypothetical protein